MNKETGLLDAFKELIAVSKRPSVREQIVINRCKEVIAAYESTQPDTEKERDGKWTDEDTLNFVQEYYCSYSIVHGMREYFDSKLLEFKREKSIKETLSSPTQERDVPPGSELDMNLVREAGGIAGDNYWRHFST